MTTILDTPRLRRATTNDAQLLAELAARLFEDTFGPDNDPEDMRSYLASAFSEERQLAELADASRVIWIALDPSDRPIGYVTMRRGTRTDGIGGDHPAEVQRIYADRGWHGRGTGAALMAACVEQARAWGCDVLWLAVWERNPRAIAFYEKKGFRKVGRQTFVLGRDIQHDHVMARSLA
ncbi:MAG TPA: GNAT family N-acetyltransferase [Gemmatimonadaceae bacterium]|nr:GNAT family N-acetyltransferase [Gemmatimonadaceae bacterium]